MDIGSLLDMVKGNLTPLTVILLVLFIASEIMGTKTNIKASSIYGVLKSMLMTAIDQAKPQPTVVPAPAVAAMPPSTTPPTV